MTTKTIRKTAEPIPQKIKERQEKAIRKGYLFNYSSDWKFTFAGTMLTRYPQCTYILDAFRRVLPGYKIPQWEDMTEKTLRNFVEEVEATTCPNTARVYFRVVKATLGARLYEQKIPFDKYKNVLKRKKVDTQSVYLNEDEIEQLYNVETRSANERHVKRLFLLSCYTGCRYSDVLRLTKANIRGNALVYVAVKTKKEVRLPLHKYVPELLIEDGVESLHRNTYNRMIQDLCLRAGIDQEITITRRGGTTTRPKYEFVSSHTARRSFATNLYLRGADHEQIRRVMGHSTIEQTMGYIKDERPFSDDIIEFFR